MLYCPFDNTQKDICLTFYFKWKYFVLTDHTFSETICLFCFCVLSSNRYPKIKFTAKNWSDLCNFYSKVIFGRFVLENIFYFSLLNSNYWCFTTILWKFQKKLNKWNLLKICLQITYPTDFCIIWILFYYGKKWIYFFKKPMTRIKLFVHR